MYILVDLIAILFEFCAYEYEWDLSDSQNRKKFLYIQNGVIWILAPLLYVLLYNGRLDIPDWRIQIRWGLNLVDTIVLHTWVKPGSTLLADYTFVVSHAISV